ncbi:MAG: DUF2723 domain-containing protein [Candidatus Eisenbacteria bacterium]|uniref:DUF2723 domain-containing protein n=1 Tax=Eiseniibacteriota bacterium TaxID=2212470 RepID=A0A933S8X9_UNCEI|nr:DUF2723 domain-containing protein [Candidatus Eisenbacteria bacterium]
MSSPRSTRSKASAAPPSPWVSVLVGAACLAVYASLTPAVPGDKDSGEFTLVLATLGLAHPTGYPLYTFAGHAFVSALHALGFGWAHAANLFSALGGAVAMGALHAVTSRIAVAAGRARGAGVFALLPVVALAPNPVWTQEATLAEVNAWHVAWCLLAALAAWRAARTFDGDSSPPSRVRADAALWGLVAGCGMAHHATSVLVALPLTLALVIVANRRGRLGAGTIAAFAAGALPPLACLGWVAWRAWHPVAGQWPVLESTWPSVADHLTGAQYRTFLGRFAPSPRQAALLARWVWPPLVPALVGAMLAWRPPASSATAVRHAIGAATVLSCGYALLYGVSDPAPYFLPALALGLALAAGSAAGMLARRGWSGGAATALLAALLLAAAPQLKAASDRNDAFASLDGLIRRMWDAIPPGEAFVVWDDDMASRLRGFQQLEDSRADLIVVQPRMLSHRAPLRRFETRHHFDPMAPIGGDSPPADRGPLSSGQLVDAIIARINVASPLPVYTFDPSLQSLRRLTKPASDSSAVTGAAAAR